jgi:glycosyltransferase involved in cell wall biosynthesis
LSEVVENRRSGLLINAKDSDGLANAILALLNNPGLLRYMSQYIYNNWITGDESWRTISNNMLKVYQKYFK